VSLERLQQLSDGARVYLVPVGFVYGDAGAFAFASTGLMFSGFRILAREGEKLLLDFRISAADLDVCINQLKGTVFAQVAAQCANLKAVRPAMKLPGLQNPLVFSKPLIMGVLNVTPDSFSDGGKYLDPSHALAHARTLIAQGADIIDIGGESTRPGAQPVWEGEEARRVVPVIEALQADGVPLSIDTRHSFVMDKALEAGAHIINDVTALSYDAESMRLAAAASDAPIILMHSQGSPKTMQENPSYNNVLLDVYDYLSARIAACELAGIDRSRLILDPGIGFGKRMVRDNLALINGLALFHALGCPILFGASRKSFIGAVTGEENVAKRLPASIAAACKAVEAGVQIVRVHDVAETKQALLMVQGFRDAAIMDAAR